MLDAECAWMRQITEAALGPASAKFRGRLVNNQMPVSVIVCGLQSLSRLQGADAELLYLSVEHMFSLRDRST